jgi:DHA2 family multidrug resistance protein
MKINKWIVAVTVMLPVIIEIIDTSVVNVSLDNIRGSLSAGIDESTWIITSYLVSNAVIIPITAWLSRFFGRKVYLMSSLLLFTASSFMCGSAWSLSSLIFFRVLQGVGGGALQPLSQAILLETFPPQEHGMAMAIFGTGTMLGPIIGPILGGWITDNWSWHWIFLINVPIGIISVLMVWLFIINPPYMERLRTKIDFWGLTLLFLGIGSLQVVLDRGQREDWFSSSYIIIMSFIAISALILFVLIEMYNSNPIINLKIFNTLSFTSGNLIMFFIFFGFFGSIVLLPIYLETLMGYTAFLSGLVLGPGGLAAMASLLIAGRLLNRISPRIFLGSGIIITAYSVYLMSLFNLEAGLSSIIWPRIVMGFGIGFVFVPLATMTMSGLRKEQMANGTAIFNLVRNLGGSVGVAFSATFLSRLSQVHQSQLIAHLTPFDRNFQMSLPGIHQMLRGKGLVPPFQGLGSNGVIYNELIRQASMLSFNDVFYFLSVAILLVLPLILLMKKPEGLVQVSPH